MPSRGDVRRGIEAALRALSIAVLVWIFWLSLDRGRPERVVSAGSSNLGAALRDWSASGLPPDRAILELNEIPVEAHRDWMRALSHSGTRMSWTGGLPPAAVFVQPVASPRGGFTVLTAAPPANRVSVEDDLGLIEAATAANGGARFVVPAASGELVATVGGTTARALPADSIHVKRVMVVGSAGWEAKFVTAALEEDGWKVDADMQVAPGVSVTQGALAPLDTALYSAVIVLDATSAPRAADITRYAASGGGVILAGATASLNAFAAIRAGEAGRIQSPPGVEAEAGSITRSALAFSPIVSLRPDAIRLQSDHGAVVSAARRHGAGRVLQTGYVDTWRWRMSGGDDAPAAHRAWWTGAVASVAYAPTVRRSTVTSDEAPVARLVAAVGPRSPQIQPTIASAAGSVSLWFLFVILSLSLLAEWTSRRLRGSR